MCIIVSKEINDKFILAKNRDRAYKPVLEVVHAIMGEVEVAYLHDVTTDWSEGLNEFGIGIVNSALLVGHDEAEHKIIKKRGKPSKDGKKIRTTLSQKTLKDFALGTQPATEQFFYDKEFDKIKSQKNNFSTDNAAFAQFDESNNNKTGVTYDTSTFLNQIESAESSDLIYDALLDSIVSTITIAKPQHPCNGAWEVKMSAGPNLGKLTYAMGYHMSPTGALIPDRSSLSKQAINSWQSVRKKSNGTPLDDIEHEKNTFHDQHHTPAPSDDCEVWYPTGFDGDLSHSYKILI